jgi:hypothetical protein
MKNPMPVQKARMEIELTTKPSPYISIPENPVRGVEKERPEVGKTWSLLPTFGTVFELGVCLFRDALCQYVPQIPAWFGRLRFRLFLQQFFQSIPDIHTARGRFERKGA